MPHRKLKPTNTGTQADAIKAAHLAMDAALRLLTPGGTNYAVTDAITTIAKDFGVTPMQGILILLRYLHFT
jgi:hypothetical protein